MRVGLFTDTYFPLVNGVATSIYTLKKQLEERGHHVYIFTTTDSNIKKNDWEEGIFRLPSLPFVSGQRLAVAYQPYIAKLIKRLALDIIHTHTEFSLGIFGRWMANKLSLPHVHTYHTIYEDYTHHFSKLIPFKPVAKSTVRQISRNFCSRADVLIVPTVKVKHLLLSYRIKNSIHIVPTGINLHKYCPLNYEKSEIAALKAQLGIHNDDIVLLYVGRIAKEKNIATLLNGLQHYLKPTLKFVIVGDGPQKEALLQLRSELKLEQAVIFTGEIPWQEIGLYYQLGDIFINASTSETQGLTYLEAMAAGLPLVAKADECLSGIVEEGITGFTFKTREQLSQKLDLIIHDQEVKANLSYNALIKSQSFSEEQFVAKIEKIYEHAIKAGHKRKRKRLINH